MSYPYDGTQSCAQTDPDLFFPDGEGRSKNAIADAKAVCNACALFSACKKYSQATPGLYGVWAGEWRDGSGYVSSLPISLFLRKEAA